MKSISLQFISSLIKQFIDFRSLILLLAQVTFKCDIKKDFLPITLNMVSTACNLETAVFNLNDSPDPAQVRRGNE